MTETPEDLPPHLGGTQKPGAMVARPMTGARVHFRGGGICQSADVVAMNEPEPLSPEFTVDLLVAAPRQVRKDRFVNNSTQPGSIRWANNVKHAEVEDSKDLTWHWPGRGCVPSVTIGG